jgi:hypothetical protein
MIPDKEFNEIWIKFSQEHPKYMDLPFDEFFLKFMEFAINEDIKNYGNTLIPKDQKEYILHTIKYGKSPLEEFYERKKI